MTEDARPSPWKPACDRAGEDTCPPPPSGSSGDCVKGPHDCYTSRTAGDGKRTQQTKPIQERQREEDRRRQRGSSSSWRVKSTCANKPREHKTTLFCVACGEMPRAQKLPAVFLVIPYSS